MDETSALTLIGQYVRLDGVLWRVESVGRDAPRFHCPVIEIDNLISPRLSPYLPITSDATKVIF